MYDRLVRHEAKGRWMTLSDPTRMQQMAQGLARKLAGVASDTSSSSPLLEDFVCEQLLRDSDRSNPTLCQQTLVEFFMVAREQLQAPSLIQWLVPLSQALQRVAALCGVASGVFYTTLIGRLLGVADTGAASPATLKLSTKEKILEAALEVFSDKGYHVATVDEIAEHAGLGKGTVYRYFANKEALFHELVRIRLEDLECRASEVLDSHDHVVTMIIKYLRVYFDFFDHNQRLYRVIVQEHLDFGDEMEELYIKKVLRRLPALKRKVYEATQQGVFKDVDFQTVFYGVMGLVHGVIQKWLAHDCSYSLLEELPTVVEILFFGFVKDHNLAAWDNLREELVQA
jgi:AcrR family transcriptional regulator